MAAVKDNTRATPIVVGAGPSIDDAVESACRSAIEQHGPSLLFDTGTLREILQRDLPGESRHAELLLAAQAYGVPHQLLAAHTAQTMKQTVAMLSDGLVRFLEIPAADARRTVMGWARILDVAHGVDAGDAVDVSNDGPAPVVESPVVRDHDRHRDVAPVNDEPRVPLATPVAPVVSARTRPSLWIAVAAVLVFASLVWFNFSRSSLDIAAVTSDGRLVADGTSHPVTVALKNSRAIVRNIEIQEVDGARDGASQVIAVPPDVSAAGEAAAGSIALRSDEARRVTYRYVLVGADGTRSSPFDKTFEFAPGPARPPTITAVTVPPDLVAGKPFALNIAYEPGSRGLAQVEMRVASSTIPWTHDVVAMPWVTRPSRTSDSIRYPFEAGLAASHTTLDFTMIDQDGARSAPQRVALDVSGPAIVARRSPAKPAARCTPTTWRQRRRDARDRTVAGPGRCDSPHLRRGRTARTEALRDRRQARRPDDRRRQRRDAVEIGLACAPGRQSPHVGAMRGHRRSLHLTRDATKRIPLFASTHVNESSPSASVARRRARRSPRSARAAATACCVRNAEAMKAGPDRQQSRRVRPARGWHRR